MARTAAIIALAAVSAGLGAAGWFALAPSDGEDRFAECREVKLAAASAIGGPFTLTSETGARMTSAELFDRPTLLYFGYTYCPDVCPVDTARNAEAVEILEERGVELRPAFITIDPQRDDAKMVGDFTANLHPKMIGLTGTEEEIAKVAKDWRVYRAKAGDDPEDYLMDHSTFTYLVAPGGDLLEVFRREHSAEQIADRAACFIDKL
ncbi:SCO family protein [Rhodovulum sp. DZ06]|uniref:SCO family protein n=1 Tax=Rhodovulum sp. DZ06 TaxID=3425126 RepID=UPI003D353FB7